MHFLAKKAQTQAVHHCTKSFNLKQNNVCLEMKQIFISKNIWKRMAWISLNKKRNASVFLILIEIFDNGCRQWLQNHCDDCSHGIKDVCYLEEKLSIWKSRNITLLTEVCIVRTMIFPVAMYGCESWTIKNAEHQRIDALELWYWRSLFPTQGINPGLPHCRQILYHLSHQGSPIIVADKIQSLHFSLVAQSCLTFCDPMDCSTPGFPVHHQLPELAQTHVLWVGDAIQPSHPLSSPSPLGFNLFQHQGLL